MNDLNLPVASDAKKELFVIFARFEFALKECGFLSGTCGKDAKANWDVFAGDTALSDLLTAVSGDLDVKELIEKPPKKQIIVCGHNGEKSWDWKTDSGPADTSPSNSKLLLAVRRVRNNLFHGAKQGEDPRDEQLCRAAKKMLLTCLEKHSGLRDMFEGKY